MSDMAVDRERGFSTLRESLCARSTSKPRSPPAKSNATSSIGWPCGAQHRGKRKGTPAARRTHSANYFGSRDAPRALLGENRAPSSVVR